MRLEHIVRSVDQMDHDELMARIDQIREGRTLPAPRTETKRAKQSVKVEDGLRAMFGKMTPEEKKKFLEGLGE